MFTDEPPTKSPLDEAIDEVYSDMADTDGAFTEKYERCVDRLVQLNALKDSQKPQRPSPDTLAMIVGNLLGIIMIVKYERANIITSKALGFVLKMR